MDGLKTLPWWFVVVLIGVAERGCVVVWALIDFSFGMLVDALAMIPLLSVVILTGLVEIGCAVA